MNKNAERLSVAGRYNRGWVDLGQNVAECQLKIVGEARSNNTMERTVERSWLSC
jgi:hypothetical protein